MFQGLIVRLSHSTWSLFYGAPWAWLGWYGVSFKFKQAMFPCFLQIDKPGDCALAIFNCKEKLLPVKLRTDLVYGYKHKY